MANGQPRPAFYVAVFAVVLGLVGLAIWRYGGGAGGGAGIFSSDELKQVAAARRNPTARASRRSRNTTSSRRRELPEVKGHLQLHADERPHGAVRHQRVGRLGADHLRQQRLQAGQGVEDARRQGLQSRARADRRPRRDARRLRRRQAPHRLGDARHGAALPRRAAQGHARDAAHLPAGRLVERRRRHRRARSDQDDGRPAREDGRARAELAVALLPPERADQRRRAAGGSAVQVHAGRVPGGRRVQRRQEPGRRRQLGAGHLQPREGQGQPDDGHDRDRQQADRRRLVLARRLRQGQPRHHRGPGPRHLRRDGGPEGAGGQAEGREADGRRLLDSRERRARHARRRALDQLRGEPRVLPEPEQSDELRADVEHGLLPLQEDRRGHAADAVRSGHGLLGHPEAGERSEVRQPEERVRRALRADERRRGPG